MKFLVLGGTGTVGSQVVRQLLEQKKDVTVLTRNPEKAKAVPTGARGVTGDLLDVATIRSVFRGMDAVFLLNGLSPQETHEGLLALNGAKLAGVKRIVYLSIHNLESASYLPHFGPKVAIEEGIKRSGIPFTILRPNHFYQNDLWIKDAMLQMGIYPQPLGNVGIARVDVRDIAEAAVLALTGSGLEGSTLSIAGPEALTGPACAEIWSKALGRKVAYAGEDMDAWEQQVSQMMPAWFAFDIRLMYEQFQRHGLKATPEEIETLTKVLGHPPRRFEDFARETAEAWTRSPSGVTA
ncbi:MAG TPA: NmrA family NAD(P)-binding protein [Candidatus Polarisedimenticolia bacterium]|nr:NmrA family NAD(P)-binding protein [Candidatus Polarisedimenticolia bacterium]